MCRITYRRAGPEDAEQLLEYLKTVGGETDNLTFGSQGIPFTLEQERSFLEKSQNDLYNHIILALDGDRIVGDCSISGSRNARLCHRREIGISVLREYWGMGIGSEFMRQLIDFARKNGVEQISLSVRADNERAKALYRKFNFISCGTIPGYIKVNGLRYDVEFMYLEL